MASKQNCWSRKLTQASKLSVSQKAQFFTRASVRQQEVRTNADIQQTSNRPQASEIMTRATAKRLNRPPVGSRRSRVAMNSSLGLPFEQMPYQCFQEARQILLQDREDKLHRIASERKRITAVHLRSVFGASAEQSKRDSLHRMHQYLERLKILADINDPMILRRFEDGLGDMNKPVYRYLAEKKWRSYKRKLLLQRIETMHVTPDLLPRLNITADIDIGFGALKVPHGDFVNSIISDLPPHLTVQVFDKGDRNVTVAVIDPDVPNPETDTYDIRCHYLATNISLDPMRKKIILKSLPDSHVVFPWLPPQSQKGAPYHRLAIFILQQPNGSLIDAGHAREQIGQRKNFNLSNFMNSTQTIPITATLFRNQWDENTKAVMERHGLHGANVEFQRKKPETLPWRYKVKDGERYR